MKDVGGISNGRGSGGGESPVTFRREEGEPLVWWWAEVLGCYQGGELKNIWSSCMATVFILVVIISVPQTVQCWDVLEEL